MTRWHALAHAVTAALAACLLGPWSSSALAAPTPLPLSGLDANATTPAAFATDTANTAYAAFLAGTPARVTVATRPDGSTAFANRQTLPASAPGDASPEVIDAPVIAASRAGDVTVAWVVETANGQSISVATRRAGAAQFADPVRVGDPDEQPAPGSLVIGMGTDGATVLAWLASASGQSERASIRTSLDGAFAPPQELFSSAANDLAIGPDGTAAIVRIRRDFSGETPQNVLEVRRRPAGAASFGPIEEVLRRAFGTYPYDATASIAVGPDGRVWLPFWIDGAPGEPSGAILAGPPAEGFRMLCGADADLVAAGGAGHVALGGLDSYGQDQLGFSFRRFTGSDPCAPFTSTGFYSQALPPLVPVIPLTLRVDARGGAHGLWAEGSQTVTLRAGYIDPAAESGRPSPTTGDLTLTTTGRAPGDFVADQAGDTLVSWLDADGPRAALLDHEPPKITSLDAVSTYTRGTPFAASATATDRHGIASIRWAVLPAFPINAPPIVEFAGPRPTLPELSLPEPTGLVRLLVTVRDSAGYETTAERRISVRAPKPLTAIKPKKPVLDLSTNRFVARTSGAPIDQGSSVKRGGSSLRVVGSVGGQATFTMTKLIEGRRVGSRCREKTRTGPRCSAERDLGNPIALSLAPGDTTLRLTGRWGSRTLAPGLYRLQVVLRTQGGGLDSAPTTITFRVRRPRGR